MKFGDRLDEATRLAMVDASFLPFRHAHCEGYRLIGWRYGARHGGDGNSIYGGDGASSSQKFTWTGKRRP
jgi:hypothetical protein